MRFAMKRLNGDEANAAKVSALAAENILSRSQFVGGRNGASYQRDLGAKPLQHRSDYKGNIANSRSDTLEVTNIDSLADSDWDSVAVSHLESNLFHRVSWGRVICATYRHKPLYLKFRRNGKLVALLPMIEIASRLTGKRAVCMPFSDFCSPLVFDAQEQEAIVETLVRKGRERKWRSFELRGGRDILPESASPGEQYYRHILKLSAPEKLFAGLSSAARRAIRKAEKSGVTADVGESWDAMREFYRMHMRTRRKHGLPPQPLSFFRNIHREIIQKGLGFIVLARLRTQPIAGAVFFHSGRSALYKFGASNESANKFRGSNLVIWHGIQELVKRGALTLDFGRTDLHQSGLRDFKLCWGATEEIAEYFKFSLRTNEWLVRSNRKSKFHEGVFRKLPLVVNRIAGRLIYPHLD